MGDDDFRPTRTMDSFNFMDDEFPRKRLGSSLRRPELDESDRFDMTRMKGGTLDRNRFRLNAEGRRMEYVFKSTDMAKDLTLKNLSNKLRESGVKPATIIHKCEKLDSRNLDTLHIDDVEQVLNEALGRRNSMTQREIHHLTSALHHPSQARGIVRYKDMFDLLDRQESAYRESANRRVFYHTDREQYRTSRRGSLGDYLANAACPAEIKNFKKFISCLEEFERKVS